MADNELNTGWCCHMTDPLMNLQKGLMNHISSSRQADLVDEGVPRLNIFPQSAKEDSFKI